MRMRLQSVVTLALFGLTALAVPGCKSEPATGDSASAPAAPVAETGGPVEGEEAEAAEAAAPGATEPEVAGTEGVEPGADGAEPEAEGAAGDDGQAGLEPAQAVGDGDDEVAAKDGEADDDAAPAKLKLLILGDSLAATGFGALLERRLDEQPQVTCYRKGKSASGLARPDFFDWMDTGKREVEWREPDYVVVIMGGNDGQDLTTPSGKGRNIRWLSEGWEDAYRERVSSFLEKVSAPGRKVIWLSLPPMGLKSLEKKLVTIRRLQKEAVEQHGEAAIYLDLTTHLVDENGEMLQVAEVKGKRREIRAEDRIHFTMSGSEYLADLVYPEILKIAGREPVEPGG